MDNKEFVQRLTTIKEKMEAIYKELRIHNAYIYHQKDYVNFHEQLWRHIRELSYTIDYYGPKNTTEEFKKQEYDTFSGFLELDTNMWNDLNIYDFDPDHGGFRLKKRDDKDRLYYL